MKIKLMIILGMDAESWRLNYGEATLAEIRQDAQQHVPQVIKAYYDNCGVKVEV